MTRITQGMTISQVIKLNPKAVEILTGHGTNCRKCPNIDKKTLIEASKKHQINLDKLLEELNANLDGRG